MSRKDSETIALTEDESPNDYKKSSSSIRLRKAVTPKIIASSIEFDNNYMKGISKKMKSSKNNGDQNKFTKFSDYYNQHMKSPLVRMQSQKSMKESVADTIKIKQFLIRIIKVTCKLCL